MITPDCRQPGLKLYAGVPELMESAFPCHILDMEKDMDGYYELKANGREVHASDFTRYTVVSEQLMGIFDPVRIQGNPFVVYACRYSFEDQEMQGTYKLQSAKGFTRPVIYPMHLIGVALNGNVVNVSGNVHCTGSPIPPCLHPQMAADGIACRRWEMMCGYIFLPRQNLRQLH